MNDAPEQTPSPSAIADAVLPFRPPLGAGPMPFVPGAGVKLPRRPAPRELGAPGVLTPLGAFVASAARSADPPSSTNPPSAAYASTRDGASSAAPPQPTSAEPHGENPSPWARSQPAPLSRTAASEAGGAPASSSDSPWARSQPEPLSRTASAEAGGAPAPSSDHPLATSSPWLSSHAFAPEVLPSAAVDMARPSNPPLPAVAPVPTEQGSRTGITVLLALAALALAAVVAYFAISAGKKSDDPADVKAGQAQKDYAMDTIAAGSATQSASAAAPKPIFKAPPPPPKPTPKRDIYDDL